MLVNRFIINLRSLNTPSGATSGYAGSFAGRLFQFPALNFQARSDILGNAGAPLVHGDPEDPDGCLDEDDGRYDNRHTCVTNGGSPQDTIEIDDAQAAAQFP